MVKREDQPYFKHIVSIITKRYLAIEHHIAALFFLGGFLCDLFIFTHIDIQFRLTLLASYIVCGAGIIAVFQWKMRGDVQESSSRPPDSFLPFIIQFTFGAILSGTFITYFQSASLTQSWVFMVALIGMLIGNEFSRSRYYQIEFQSVVWFVCLYAYMITLIPSIQNSIGASIFMESTLVSLVVFGLFVSLVMFLNKKRSRETLPTILKWTAGVTLVTILFYFGRIIPPIPLIETESLVCMTLIHDTTGNYTCTQEVTPMYMNIFPFLSQYHFQQNTPLFFYSSVYAPAKLTTPIIHEWQHKDNATGSWSTVMRISFPITGGRTDGFRGYSQKNITPGKWRVRVTTTEGHVIGTRTFTVSEGIPLNTTEIKR